MGDRIQIFSGWGLALLGSILLNFCLFALMPGLIRTSPDTPSLMEHLNPAQVVRIKRLEPQVEKKKQIKPLKPQPVEKALSSRKPAPQIEKPSVRPTLAFELNSKLPPMPMDLAVPMIDNIFIDTPVLKSLYEMGELDTPLTALVKIPPVYPFRAKRRGIEGFVSIEFLVTKKGETDQIKILESQPENIFDKTVKDCVSRWKFKPGTVEGISVATLVRTTIKFKLKK